MVVIDTFSNVFFVPMAHCSPNSHHVRSSQNSNNQNCGHANCQGDRLNASSSQNSNSQNCGRTNCQGNCQNASSCQTCGSQKQCLPNYDKDALQRTKIGLPPEEVLKACAARELWEETGLRVDVQQAQYLCAFITPDVEVVRQQGGFDCVFFIACINDVQGVHPDNTEVVAAVWATPEEAMRKFLIGPPQRQAGMRGHAMQLNKLKRLAQVKQLVHYLLKRAAHLHLQPSTFYSFYVRRRSNPSILYATAHFSERFHSNRICFPRTNSPLLEITRTPFFLALPTRCTDFLILQA
eukprot:GEMP01034619.1.p1 GENE.GEMP01034619.1~~GEMP01034619.1.p1  ORF type:complete len:294 (+),score=42.95 GEMP01034619.1:318-1199(+)